MTPQSKKHVLSEREMKILVLAAKPLGVLIPNNRGWRAAIAECLSEDGLIERVDVDRSGTVSKFRWMITKLGLASLAVEQAGTA